MSKPSERAKEARLVVDPALHRHAKRVKKARGMLLYELTNRALRLGFEAMGVPCPEVRERAPSTKED